MGLLVDGVWKDKWYDTEKHGGEFKRTTTTFRNWITKDGSPGPSGKEGFNAQKDRYHLYVSLACPWAHRTLIMRELKGLQEIIPVSVVHWLMLEHGWTFKEESGATGDQLMGHSYLYEVYLKADENYTGRVTVPVLWDTHSNTIVNNESSEIMRMFNSAFDGAGARDGDFYPEEKVEEINSFNSRIYETVNNGVYKCGFATTQEAYEEALKPLFESLDWLEETLQDRPYLCGEQLTEADWRLFTTLIRFDAVYVGHFKCNLKRIYDYPNLKKYVQNLYKYPGIAKTVDMLHIKNHYYQSHKTINPTGIVPKGPQLDFDVD